MLFLGLWLVGSLQCQFSIDRFDIPRLRAPSEASAWACVGYMHGRDRIYVMEFMRLATEGRLSEIYGLKRLKTDIFFRILDLDGTARRITKQLSPESRALYEAYARGVNAGMRNPSVVGVSNFRHLEHPPDPWKVEHSIAVFLLQSFFQTRRGLFSDIRADKVLARYKQKADLLLDETKRPWFTSVIKDYELAPQAALEKTTSIKHRPNARLARALDEILAPLDELGLSSAGSNNFVVSGKLTSSGRPLLGNDPHLELKDPPFFYWIGIEAPGIQWLVATVPGAPSMPLGISDKIAWGLTNSFFDMSNLVVLKKSSTPLISTTPWIWINLGVFKFPFFFKSAERTNLGYPVVPLEPESLADDEFVALYWTGSELSVDDFNVVFDLPKAQSVEDFSARLKRMRIPSWHFVFADQKGNIGYRLNGPAPKYEGAPPWGFQHHERFELLTQEENPSLINPSRGFIVTANNAPWPPSHKFSSGNAQEPSFRAWRFEKLIQESGPLNFETTQKIQCDNLMIDSQFLVPKLVALFKDDKTLPKELVGFLGEIQTTELVADSQCRLCSLYQLWMERLRERTDLEEMSLFAFLDSEKFPESSKFAKETLLEAHRILWNPRTKSWKLWHEVHRNDFGTYDGRDRSEEFSLATTGGEHSINLGQARWQEEKKYFKQDYGPSVRLLVELSTPPKIRMSFPGANRRSMDLEITKDEFATQWARCEYNEVPFRTTDEAAALATTVRIP